MKLTKESSTDLDIYLIQYLLAALYKVSDAHCVYLAGITRFSKLSNFLKSHLFEKVSDEDEIFQPDWFIHKMPTNANPGLVGARS